jgi:hypothetical protein
MTSTRFSRTYWLPGIPIARYTDCPVYRPHGQELAAAAPAGSRGFLAGQPPPRRDYAEVASVTGDEVWEASTPFPVAVSPADLVRGV